MVQRAVKKAKLSEAKAQSRPVKSDSESEANEEELSERSESSEDDEGLSEEDVSESEAESEAEGEIEGDASDSEANEDSDSSDTAPAEARVDPFDKAMSAILGSKIKSHDAKDPVLIRNKRSAKEIETAREDAKVRRALKAERLHNKDKARVKDVIPKDPEEAGDVLANEKKLRKTAQRGVIRLLNAIQSAQSAALHGASSGTDKRVQEANVELSKEKFLDMIRMG